MRDSTHIHTNGVHKGSRVWIDCDPGVDDAQALLLALAHPGVEFVGISCVHGNVPLDQVLKNLHRVLRLGGSRGVPVYRGCSQPWIGNPIELDYWHGLDGLGDVPEMCPTPEDVANAPVTAGHACAKLVEAAAARPGELVVIALGPLTNIAMACQLDPSFPANVGRLVVMGGAQRIGNITPAAEFNFYADPEAAQLVLRRFHSTVLLSWEATLEHSLPWGWFDAWLAKPTHKAKFMAAIVAKSMRGWRAENPELGWTACDPLAVAVALQPDMVLATKQVYCDVELDGRLTRGMSVFDWNNRLKQKPNVQLVTSVDLEQFKRMMDRSLE